MVSGKGLVYSRWNLPSWGTYRFTGVLEPLTGLPAATGLWPRPLDSEWKGEVVPPTTLPSILIARLWPPSDCAAILALIKATALFFSIFSMSLHRVYDTWATSAVETVSNPLMKVLKKSSSMIWLVSGMNSLNISLDLSTLLLPFCSLRNRGSFSASLWRIILTLGAYNLYNSLFRSLF